MNKRECEESPFVRGLLLPYGRVVRSKNEYNRKKEKECIVRMRKQEN
jgi:hypothetical protein